MAEPKDPYAPIYGEPLTDGEARYLVEPVAGSKRLQASYLRFDDGREWIVSYRPQPEHFAFVDKRVVFSGRPYTSSPYVQSVDGTHVELTAITLAPGEPPYDPPPTELPAPPRVETLDALAGRVGRYAHCVGTLERLAPDPDATYWQNGSLLLGDQALPLVHIRNREASPSLVGQQVTVLGKVLDGPRLHVETICPGVVERCRMTMD